MTKTLFQTCLQKETVLIIKNLSKPQLLKNNYKIITFMPPKSEHMVQATNPPPLQGGGPGSAAAWPHTLFIFLSI